MKTKQPNKNLKIGKWTNDGAEILIDTVVTALDDFVDAMLKKHNPPRAIRHRLIIAIEEWCVNHPNAR